MHPDPSERRALVEAEARDAIYDWIREDAPLTVKMRIEPSHVDALVRRLAALRTDPDARVAEMREAAAKVADEWSSFTGCRSDQSTDGLPDGAAQYARGQYHARVNIAAAIRSLSLPEGGRS